ncbi:UBP1-associated protein 2A-like [Impatiens glandulifera]|uniref:UBP1-associated protein 2A-like n=1 Tax=Impatiens glandulifera TaxID=253017 RepID=UPI001FB11A20|nr:UBP1-associated protein 2A-like [Impatiens glandulifera]
MAKKRKIRSDEPASTGAPLPDQLQTLTEPASTGAPLPEQLQTLIEPASTAAPLLEQLQTLIEPASTAAPLPEQLQTLTEPASTAAPLPEQLQTLTEPASTGAPLPEKLQTLTEPKQPAQQIEIKAQPQTEQNHQTRQPEGGLVAVQIEDKEKKGSVNGCKTVKMDGGDKELDEEPIEKILESLGKDQLIAIVKESVSKFPNVMKIVKKTVNLDPARRKICVHGLVLDNMETLIEVFRKYGEIVDCEAACDKESGKSIGYGFIIFKRRSAAMKALKHPQEKIGNQLISCQLSSDGFVPAPVGPPAIDNIQRKICIYNVSADIDPQKLTEFFARYGKIEEGPLGLDEAGKFKGFCLFVYKTMEGYRRALQEPQKIFDGMILNCQKSIKPYVPDQRQNQQLPSKPTPAHLKAPSAPAIGFKPPALGPAFGHALAAALLS